MSTDAPQLRRASRSGFTSASLRDYYRYVGNQVQADIRLVWSYELLHTLITRKDFSLRELRAAAQGIRLAVLDGQR